MTSGLRRPVPASEKWERWCAIGRQIVARYPAAKVGFLSGSFLDGFATPTSDLDVFILVDDELATVEDTATASFAGDGRRIDIDYVDEVATDTEVWPLDVVASIAAELETVDLADWNAAGAVDDAKLNLAHRIRIGEPLTGEETFHALQNRFDWTRLSVIIRNRFLASYNNLSDDAIGAIQAADPMTSVLMSREALGAAADALTAAVGHTNPKPKWRWRKFLQLGLDELASAYKEAEMDSGSDEETMISSSKKRLRLASEFVVRASSANPGR